MQYLIVFVEGIISFISPCHLPLLPIYIAYIAGGNDKTGIHKSTAFKNSSGFVIGFTIVYVLMGAFAGSIGSILHEYEKILNLIFGIIIILFGMNFLGFLPKIFSNHSHEAHLKPRKVMGFGTSTLFGILFAAGWTPCVGAFLGSALLWAGQRGSILEGTLMLLCFSLGLGIPFIISALLIDKLTSTFELIKNNLKTVTIISGIFLIIMGFLMATGVLQHFLGHVH